MGHSSTTTERSTQRSLPVNSGGLSRPRTPGAGPGGMVDGRAPGEASWTTSSRLLVIRRKSRQVVPGIAGHSRRAGTDPPEPAGPRPGPALVPDAGREARVRDDKLPNCGRSCTEGEVRTRTVIARTTSRSTGGHRRMCGARLASSASAPDLGGRAWVDAPRRRTRRWRRCRQRRPIARRPCHRECGRSRPSGTGASGHHGWPSLCRSRSRGRRWR